ncbi:hypothetical protein ACOME3_010277 [Neoechinorhynchus agilis]
MIVSPALTVNDHESNSVVNADVITFNFDSDHDLLVSASQRLQAAQRRNSDLRTNSGNAIPRHCSRILAVMNAMRKQRDFCDVTIITNQMPSRAHKAVLAAASPVFLEMFHINSQNCGENNEDVPISTSRESVSVCAN